MAARRIEPLRGGVQLFDSFRFGRERGHEWLDIATMRPAANPRTEYLE